MATANAATNYLERRLLHFIFKNNSLSFSSPGDSIYVGLATAVSAAETGSVTEATFTNYHKALKQLSIGSKVIFCMSMQDPDIYLRNEFRTSKINRSSRY